MQQITHSIVLASLYTFDDIKNDRHRNVYIICGELIRLKVFVINLLWLVLKADVSKCG